MNEANNYKASGTRLTQIHGLIFLMDQISHTKSFDIHLLFYLIIHVTRTVCLVFSKHSQKTLLYFVKCKESQDLPCCLVFFEILVLMIMRNLQLQVLSVN